MSLPKYAGGENFTVALSFVASDGSTPVAVSTLSNIVVVLQQKGGESIAYAYPSGSLYAGATSNALVLEVTAAESARLHGVITARVQCGWPDATYQRGGGQQDVFCLPVAEVTVC